MTSSSTSRTTATTTKTTTISAPGKALIAGGYLVLESPNPGLVLATDSCFHVTISIKDTYQNDQLKLTPIKSTCNIDDIDDTDIDISSFPVDVYSVQFHQVYTYTVILHASSSLSSPPTSTSPSSNASSSYSSTVPFLTLKPRYLDQPSNSYIEKTLIVTLSTIFHSTSPSQLIQLGLLPPNINTNNHQQQQQSQQALSIQLQADNDFYSSIQHLQTYNLQPLPNDILKLPKFLPCPIDSVNDKVIISKTGLGSSAALITALVGSLFVYFNLVQLEQLDLSKDDDKKGEDQEQSTNIENTSTISTNTNTHSKKLIHNTSQLCHSFAQGKIGSGFDVSAAVYGSHFYTRFDKDVILHVMDQLTNDFEQNNNENSTDKKKDGTSTVTDTATITICKQTVQLIVECIHDYQKWNSIVEPLNLPDNMELLMADICGGSESPSMAKKVLAWKKKMMMTTKEEEEEKNNGGVGAEEWKNFEKINHELKTLFQKTTSYSIETIEDENTLWKDICTCIKRTRQNLKQMGENAGVPIEPDEQTKLANDTMNISGVIAAGVPGAGGYDALFVLYKNDDEIRNRIGQFWMEWCEEQKKDGGRGIVCPLACKSARYGQGLHQSEF